MDDVTCATFATSPTVTPKLLQRLNNCYPKHGENPPVVTNFFNPVRHDVSKMLKTSEKPVDFAVDVFEGALPEALVQIFTDNFLGEMLKLELAATMTYAVLDERSAQDETVIICYEQILYDDETDEETGKIMHVRRVRFTEAYDLVRMIEDCNIGTIGPCVIEAGDHFTYDGVFDFKGAVTAVCHGWRAPTIPLPDPWSGLPKLC